MEIEKLSTAELEKLLNERKAKEQDEKNANRKRYETLKEDTINSLCASAQGLEDIVTKFKIQAFGELCSLYELLQEYSKRHNDGKGNFTLENAGQTLKVEFSKQQLGYFDERANQAEKHIIDFVNKQFAGDAKTKRLITSLLERKKGKLDIKLVQKLYAMENEYDDPNWKEGIKLLKESWTPSDTKDYIRFWRKDDGVYKIINLNFSSIKLTA